MKYKILKIKNDYLYLDKIEPDDKAEKKCAGCGGCSVFKREYPCSVIRFPLPKHTDKEFCPGQILNLNLDSKKIVIASFMVFVIPLIILFVSMHCFSGYIDRQFIILLTSLIPVAIYYLVFRKIINFNPYSIESID